MGIGPCTVHLFNSITMCSSSLLENYGWSFYVFYFYGLHFLNYQITLNTKSFRNMRANRKLAHAAIGMCFNFWGKT